MSHCQHINISESGQVGFRENGPVDTKQLWYVVIVYLSSECCA